ncbi:unnamed protein product, partial [marine sediment metagenome]
KYDKIKFDNIIGYAYIPFRFLSIGIIPFWLGFLFDITSIYVLFLKISTGSKEQFLHSLERD